MNVAQAGQTVKVEPGLYKAENTITTSGTASAPITIEGDDSEAGVYISGVAHAFDVSGASNIVIQGFQIGGTSAEPVLISNSDNVTVQQLALNNEYEATSFQNDQIHVTGDSVGIDISRNVFALSTTTAVQIDGGGSDDTVTTNIIGDVEGDGIVVATDPGAVVTSNTVDDTCGSGIALTGYSNDSTVENNIVADTLDPTNDGTKLTCPASTGPVAGLEVDHESTEATVANYNDVDSAEDAVVDYNWGGATYPTAAAFNAGTQQGAADSSAGVLSDDFSAAPNGPNVSAPEEGSAAINSANSDAPGELATDVYGDARVDDPLVPNTGVGTYSDYDRGAVQRQDTVSYPGSPASYPLIEDIKGNQVSQAPTGAPISVVGTAVSAWGGSMTYTVDFGDGSTPVTETDGTATHTYTTGGDFNIEWTARTSYGAGTDFSESIEISSAAPDPQLTVTSTGALSVSVNPSASTDPWEIYGYLVDFGDGYSTGSVNAGTTSVTHTYAKAGKYTITLTLQDETGDSAQTTATYTTEGSDFTADGPTRILDTRQGTGTGGVIAKVAGGSSINVKVGGTKTIPADATAVALNLTETDATSIGFITAYPTGQSEPTTSNLNYAGGLVKATSVIVGLGKDGEITLANSASKSTGVDLVADVAGYFTQSSSAGYQPITPLRVLDTRKGTGTGGKIAKVPSDGTLALNVQAPAGTSAVVMNLTVTDDPVGGLIIAYPGGTTRPATSSLNFPANTTVPNTVVVPVSANGVVELYNDDPQGVDLVADVEGYFTASATGAFMPVTPSRIYDTRATAAPLGANDVATLQPSEKDAALPSTAAAYVYNVTVTDSTAPGFITAYPAGTSVPITSNVNYAADQTTANSAITEAGSGGSNTGADSFDNVSKGTVQLIVDVFGYFTSD